MAYQTSLASRVEFLEKSLGDSATKHSQVPDPSGQRVAKGDEKSDMLRMIRRPVHGIQRT